MTSQIIIAPKLTASGEALVDVQFHNLVALPDDFDSAIGTAVVLNAEDSEPTVVSSPFDSAEVLDGWVQHYIQLTNCEGKKPVIQTDYTNIQNDEPTPRAPVAPWNKVWQEIDETPPPDLYPRPWTKFDMGGGDPTYVVANNAPFTAKRIGVAFKPRSTYLNTEQVFAYCLAHPFGSNPPSVVAHGGAPSSFNFLTPVTSHTNGNSVALPTSVDQLAVRLEDTSVQPDGGAEKLIFAIGLDCHASEDQGFFAGIEMINRFLAGTTTIADEFRKKYILYVYSENPQNKYLGSERWLIEEGKTPADPNRQYDQPGGSEQVEALKTATTLDMPNGPDIWFSFHGWNNLTGNGRPENWGTTLYTDTNPITNDREYFNSFNTILPGDPMDDLGGSLFGAVVRSSKGYFAAVVGAQLSTTVEFGVSTPGYPDTSSMYGSWVDTTLLAFDDMIARGKLVLRTNESQPARVEQAQAIDTVTAITSNFATPNKMTQGQAIEATSGSSSASAQPDAIEQGQTIDQAIGTHTAIVAPLELTQGQSIETTNGAAAGTAIIAAVEQGQEIDSTAATHQAQATPARVEQLQDIEIANSTQASLAQPSGLEQGQTIDQVAATIGGIAAAVDRIEQAQELEATAPIAKHFAIVSGITQAQLIDIAYHGNLFVGEVDGTVSVYSQYEGKVTIYETTITTIH